MKKFSVDREQVLAKALWLVLLTIVVALPKLAWAQGTSATNTATATMIVGVQVTGGCSVSLNSVNLNFPDTTVLATTETGSLPITVTCSPALSYTVGLGPGQGGSVTARVLTQGTNATGGPVSGTPGTLPYALYQNSSMTTPWENTSQTEESGMGTGSAQTLTVYAQLPASTTSPNMGTYGDYLPIIVTY